MIQEDNAYYIREPNGSLIACVDGTDTSYYHFDALGSTVMLTDSTGAETDRYAYDAWGATLAHTGSSPQPYQYVGQLGYYTHHQTPDLGLMQLGVRFYDAEVGRFGQRDVEKRFYYSDYIYADDHPVGLIDPTGNKPGDYEVCTEKYKNCLEKSNIQFTKCISNSVGVSDISLGMVKCIIGCGLLEKLIKYSYKSCCAACGALLIACTWVDIESCQKVLDSEASSCDSAFQYCKDRANR